MKKELLIPVGNFSCLEYAIANGADAVYLGLKNFNARSYAANFDREEMKKAIRLCHLYGAKIYVTMNIIIKDQEVDDFIDAVSFLHKTGVDAIIMQDIGMICLLREMFPNLEIHASTQTNSCMEETISLFYELGVKRVVLPREMSLEEISSISIPIEKEVFIHGALCMSYSGCCLMSSMIGGRSGNRGECTGCCRLPYTLYHKETPIKEGYLLSTKELNTSSRIQELLSSDITSFKVEGRMKSPLYVGFITRFYRKLIDGEAFSYEEELKQLKILFNRDFTLGHLFHDDICNPYSPNHLGLSIGKVVALTKEKIAIFLTYPLYQEDGLRFQKAGRGFVANFIYDEKGKLISEGKVGETVFVDNKIGLTKKDEVYKTTSKKIGKELLSIEDKKIPIRGTMIAKKNQALTMIVEDGTFTVSDTSSKVELAKTAPLTKEQLVKQFSKLGGTPFVFEEIKVKMDDDIFIPLGIINELRRRVVDQLINKREEQATPFLQKEVSFPILASLAHKEISLEVKEENDLKSIDMKRVDQIYVSPSIYQTHQNLEKYYAKESWNDQISSSRKLTRYLQKPKSGESIISDYTFHVTNIYSVYYLLKLGYKKVTLSVELTDREISTLFSHFQEVFHFIPSLEVIMYHRPIVMFIKGNILELEEKKTNYYLKDQRGRLFPILYQDGYTYVYNYEVITRSLKSLHRLPISCRFSILEGKDEISKLVKSGNI